MSYILLLHRELSPKRVIARSESQEELRVAALRHFTTHYAGEGAILAWGEESWIRGAIDATEPLFIDGSTDDDSHYLIVEE